MIRMISGVGGEKLQVFLSNDVETNELPVVACFTDTTQEMTSGSVRRRFTNGLAVVDIVDTPGAYTIRHIDFVSVFNSDTASATVTVRYDIGGTYFVLGKWTLNPGDLLTYTSDSSWRVSDLIGQIKIVGSGGAGGTGTVASVAMSVPTSLLTLSGSPISTAGTFAVGLAAQVANRIFAGPASGSSAAPTFRALVVDDIANGMLTYAKIQNVSSGDRLLGRISGAGVIEEITCTGTGRAMIAADTASAQRTLLGLGSAALASSSAFATASQGVLADSSLQPDDIGVSIQEYDALLQDIVNLTAPAADRILFYDQSAGTLTWLTVGSGLGITGTTLSLTGGGAGTVTSVDMTVPTSILQISGNPITTGGTLALSLKTQPQRKFFMGPASGVDAVPTFRDMESDDIPSGIVTYSKIQNTSGGDKLIGRISGAGVVEEIACTAAGRALLDDADASAQRTTLGLGSAATTASSAYATAAQGDTADSALQPEDIGVSVQEQDDFLQDIADLAGPGADRILFYDQSAGAFTWLSISGGLSITGTTLSSSVSSGTVTSVNASVPTSVLSVTGGPITDSGTLAISLATQQANKHFMGPASGADAAPTFRALTTDDLPDDVVTYAKIQNVSATDKLLGRSTSGAGNIEEIPCSAFIRTLLDDADAATARSTLGVTAGGGTVTSVALSAPGIFSVGGSPVTTSGTLALSLATQTANTIFAGPTTGSAAAPTFRVPVSADYPGNTINYASLVNATGAGLLARITNSAGNLAMIYPTNIYEIPYQLADGSVAFGFPKPWSTQTVRCRAFRNAGHGTQSIANNTWVVIEMPSESYDTDGLHDNSSFNTRLTIPAGMGGPWLFLLEMDPEYSSGNHGSNIRLLVNSGELARWIVDTGATRTFMYMYTAAAADVFEIAILQLTGSTRTFPAGGGYAALTALYLGRG